MAGKRKVEVYLLSPDVFQQGRLQAGLALLDEMERRRYDRYIVDRAKVLHLGARVLARLTLAPLCAVSPSSIRFETNAFGKPRIADSMNSRQVCFNLAHTDGLVVLAVTSEVEIGVDVENIHREVRNPERIARVMFSPVEAAQISSLAGEARSAFFYETWTLKEAYIKATGEGLSHGLRHFWFEIAGDEAKIQYEPHSTGFAGQFQFHLRRIYEHYQVALALGETQPYEISWIDVTSRISQQLV